MKHFVNLSLLASFVTLVVTGLLRFFRPFDLVVTRVHITFGIATLVFVAFHLAGRGKYFAAMFRRPNRPQAAIKHPLILFFGVLIGWGYGLVASWQNYWPVDVLIGATYEARHTQEIFRDHPQTAFELIDSGLRVKRVSHREASIRLELEWGDAFPIHAGKAKPLGNQSPQVAIWAETEDGTVLETLFVSQACATAKTFDWHEFPLTRADVLPVWSSRYKASSGSNITSPVDGISSATPERDFTIEGYLSMDAQPFSVYVEVNAPSDPNDYFHHRRSSSHDGFSPEGVGQPSIIYEAFVFPEDHRRYYLLELSSRSTTRSENDSGVTYNLDHLTTAKRLIEKILLHVHWPRESGGTHVEN